MVVYFIQCVLIKSQLVLFLLDRLLSESKKKLEELNKEVQQYGQETSTSYKTENLEEPECDV